MKVFNDKTDSTTDFDSKHFKNTLTLDIKIEVMSIIQG